VTVLDERLAAVRTHREARGSVAGDGITMAFGYWPGSGAPVVGLHGITASYVNFVGVAEGSNGSEQSGHANRRSSWTFPRNHIAQSATRRGERMEFGPTTRYRKARGNSHARTQSQGYRRATDVGGDVNIST